MLFGGYPEIDLENLLSVYPGAESTHLAYMKLVKEREQRVLVMARELAGADGDADDFMPQARSQWVELVGKPMLENLQSRHAR